MIKKSIFFLLLFFSFTLILPLTLKAEEPLPPNELIDWLDYALKRFPPHDCPYMSDGTKICAGITNLNISGDLNSGQLQMEFTGYNWSRKEQEINLLGPSSQFALTDSTIKLTEQLDPMLSDAIYIAPYFDTSGGFWKINVPPGKFLLKTSLNYQPESILPINLATGIGYVNTSNITGGFAQHDQSLGNHGGNISFVFSKTKDKPQVKPQVRTTRIFNWGAIPTFRYIISVNGLQSDKLIKVALLGNEMIEKITPQKSYRIETSDNISYIETTFPPSQTQIEISGHYTSKPNKFIMNSQLPFEVWLFVENRRHPVQIKPNANPIDHSEFAHLADTSNAHAYLVKQGQYLEFYPITVNIDKGRKGKATALYKFFEGHKGLWLEKLFLTASVPEQDRLVIPTPNTPQYAGIGNNSIEMYQNADNQLSVRLPREGLNDKTIMVDWYSLRKTNPLLFLFKANIPGQKVYTEKQDVQVFFHPGQVPLFSWGATTSTGDLVNQFHLYGFLIGILAFFICRGLKFGYVLSFFVTLLCIGLYTTPDFPLIKLIVLLVVTLPFALFKDDFIEKLKSHEFKRNLMMFIWILIYATTAFQLASYSRDRIYTALHPYAGYQPTYAFNSTQQTSEGYSGKRSYKNKSARPSKLYDFYENDLGAEPEAPPAASQYNYDAAKQINQQVTKLDNRLTKSSEWTAKPVTLKNTLRSSAVVKLTNLNLLPDNKIQINILVAGPITRAIWLLFETLLILWMMIALLIRVKRIY